VASFSSKLFFQSFVYIWTVWNLLKNLPILLALIFESKRRSNTTMASLAQESQHVGEKQIWYRGTLFNAFIIGSVGFLAPGLWNAMSSLGAGGAESPFLVNAANALVFGLSS
jgi:hypothetical protein